MRKYLFADVRSGDPHFCSSGDKIRKKYVLDVSDTGEEKLVEVGQENIQDVIQSHVGACDLKAILKRHEMMGTTDQLKHGNGNDLNLCELPKNLHEMKAAIDKADSLFQQLKPEIKAKFASVEDFLAGFGSVAGLMAFANAYKAPKEDPKEDPKVGGGVPDAPGT